MSGSMLYVVGDYKRENPHKYHYLSSAKEFADKISADTINGYYITVNGWSLRKKYERQANGKWRKTLDAKF